MVVYEGGNLSQRFLFFGLTKTEEDTCGPFLSNATDHET
jgi:hypothetical protein